MSIYSANRSGRLSNDYIVEKYNDNQIGLILYEAQQNDQALFEAALKADFQEIHGRTQGTLLESEIAALNEANAKSFFTSIKTALMRFWNKIKEVFSAAKNKIAAYIGRDGAAFVKEYERVASSTKSHGLNESIDIGDDDKYHFDSTGVTFNPNEITKLISELATDDNIGDKSTDDCTKILYGKVIGANGETDKDDMLAELKKKTLIGVDKITPSNYKAEVAIMKDQLNNKYLISGLQVAQKDCEDVVKAFKVKIEAKEKLKYDDDDAKQAMNAEIKALSLATSAMQTVVSVVCSSKIKYAKAALRNSRKIMTQIMHNMKTKVHNNSAFIESAVLAAEEEVEMALNDDIGFEPTDDLD